MFDIEEEEELEQFEADAVHGEEAGRRRRLRRARVFRDRINLDFPVLEEFRSRFRVTVMTAEAIERGIGDMLKYGSERNNPLTPRQQLLTALRFYATDGFYQLVADGHGPSRSTVFRAVHKVTGAICRRFADVVCWPDDVEEVKQAFFEKAGMPDVVGCIDGTHLPLTVPARQRALYVNRKGFCSINCMAVCGPDRTFYAVSTNCTGRVHDARVLRNSGVPDRFRADGGHAPQRHLLGDSAYPLTTWLLTPVAAPATPAEEAYNRAHCRTRVVIENAFGVAKRRFPVLGSGLRIRSIRRSVRVFRACIILHNICQIGGDFGEWMGADEVVEERVVPEAPEVPAHVAAERRAGQERRNALIRRFE